MSLYRIKPLEWTEIRPGWWQATSIFGTLDVEQFDDGSWHWRYCFDEFYDDGLYDCESADAGKAEVEKFYLNRLLPSLVPA